MPTMLRLPPSFSGTRPPSFGVAFQVAVQPRESGRSMPMQFQFDIVLQLIEKVNIYLPAKE